MTEFQEACQILRDRGHTVEPSDIQGLTLIDGRELTVGQVIDMAFL